MSNQKWLLKNDVINHEVPTTYYIWAKIREKIANIFNQARKFFQHSNARVNILNVVN